MAEALIDDGRIELDNMKHRWRTLHECIRQLYVECELACDQCAKHIAELRHAPQENSRCGASTALLLLLLDVEMSPVFVFIQSFSSHSILLGPSGRQ
jgi:hypothetical protein